MASKNNSSLASDLTRIVILGIAFDLSRYVAKEILKTTLSIATNYFNDDDTTSDEEFEENRVAQQHVGKQQANLPHTDASNKEDDGDEGYKGEEQHDSSAVIGVRDGIPSLTTLSIAEIIQRWKIHLCRMRIMQHFPKAMHGKGRVGLLRGLLCCYLLLSPPLVMYSAWNSPCKNGNNNKDQQSIVRSSALFRRMCFTCFSTLATSLVTSLVTSFGVILWIVPEMIWWRKDDEDDDDENIDENNEMEDKTIHHDNRRKHSENLQEPSVVNAAEGIAKMPSIPSSITHPPLVPTIHELERRPRSDSLPRSIISECSVSTQTINAPQPALTLEKSQEKKYLEILVHNVSHTDLILGLSGDDQGLDWMAKRRAVSSIPSFPAEFEDTPRKKNALPHNNDNNNSNATTDSEEYIMCRPRFSAFDLFSRRVLCELQGQIESSTTSHPSDEEVMVSSDNHSTSSSSNNNSKHHHRHNHHPLYKKIISYPRYERSNKTARYTLVTPRPSEQFLLPVGFNLERAEGVNNTSVDPCEMPNLRLRGRDIPKVDPSLLGETPRRANLPVDSIPPLPPSLQELETIRYSPDSKKNDEEASGIQTPPPGRPDGGNSTRETLRINAVFFPLLATLLPRWLGKIADKFGGGGEENERKKVAAPLPSPNVKKVVVLVSGVGTPRNWTHSISGNSTEACAELMELFIHVLYPDITVVRIHSDTNIFRYDENITFATQELMPCIDSYRDAHARCEPYPDEMVGGKQHASTTLERNPFNPDWRQSVSVTYSFADGSAARSHAIQASLRPYRPTYFHFWQLKTFWHESKITDEDIEVHSFEEMETVPAMAIDQTSNTVMMVVNEMKKFRKEFIETLKDGGRSDMKSFWLRKTKKPVLAVLLVQKPGGAHVLYRGTNMEVSMPTGSLCAERNVIGTALANDPGLKREDLLMVAVLSLQLPQYSPPPGPPICQPVMSSSKDGTNFAQEIEDKLKQHQTHGGMRRNTSISSFASIAEDGPPVSTKSAENEGWEMNLFEPVAPLSPLGSPALAPVSSVLAANPSTPRAKEAMMIPELSLSRLSEKSPSSIVSGQSTPKRRISLYQKKSHSKMGGGVKRQKESLLVQSLEDMNPLKPCGACNEWLKKIAESNPHFKVLTFTDTKCNGVYVSPCQE